MKQRLLLGVAMILALSLESQTNAQSMATGLNGYQVSPPIFTVGETINGYTPPGVLDGMGAFRLNRRTVRVLVTHELLNFRGYEYQVEDGAGGNFGLTGARISYFDIDRRTKQVVDAGPAIRRFYDANGNVAANADFLSNNFAGLSRLCSAQMVEDNQFFWPNVYKFWLYRIFGRRCGKFGLEDPIFFAGEEDGGSFNRVGGAEWALDVKTGDMWQLPDLGRGAWENVTQLDTGSDRTVAFLLADDSSPIDFDNDDINEAAPMYLYVGRKNRHGNFLERNGLSGGKLYVWVARNGARTPTDFNGSGSLKGDWVQIDNSPGGTPSEDGSTGYDEYGYPTQGMLWLRARDLGAFGFSRPEDLSTNPYNGRVAVLASTGVDTYENGVDTFGTIYTFRTNFSNLACRLTIIYDGDADPDRNLRSPDNLEWSDSGYIFVQEDEAEEDTLDGEPLFGVGAVNPNEAGIVRLNPFNGELVRVANIDRNVVLDASIADPTNAIDRDAGAAGEWESSGIIDVSRLFGRRSGTLFLFNVQAHGIEDQTDDNPDSRINDDDLVEGGQLLFLHRQGR